MNGKKNVDAEVQRTKWYEKRQREYVQGKKLIEGCKELQKFIK